MSVPEGLTLVTGLAELTPGMAVYGLRCGVCGRDHWMFLLQKDQSDEGLCRLHREAGATRCPRRGSWRLIWCCDKPACMEYPVREGRIYRQSERDAAQQRVRGFMDHLESNADAPLTPGNLLLEEGEE